MPFKHCKGNNATHMITKINVLFTFNLGEVCPKDKK
jgi:hypothetical protein